MYSRHSLILLHLLPTFQSVAAHPSPQANPDHSDLAWSFNPHDLSHISSLREPLQSRALTFPLGTSDWDFIIDDLFTFIPVEHSTPTFMTLYNYIRDIGTVEYIQDDPLPVLVVTFGRLSLELSAPIPIPSSWLYTFAVQMLPMAENGGLVGQYRVRFKNRRSGVTLLARLAVGPPSGLWSNIEERV